jgi:antitoxin (DNA-binding transcriptional repressor) of toxin-antitoxin stability system
MQANIVDLRYKMNDVLKALDRNEKVTILYRGKPKGVIHPIEKKEPMKMQDHPFFGMHADDKRPVSDVMDELRAGRYRDI